MKNKQKPTDAELELLKVLWKHGPSTVSQVHALLKNGPSRGYTTILKLMQIMTEKGFVKRDESRRAHVYRAAISNEQVHQNYLKYLLNKVFDNSTGKLVARALTTQPVSPEELAEIRQILDKIEEGSK
jgi:predicted transcriptional regulator